MKAGAKNAPTLLLLHGFPTSSHMFRNLIPTLADRYHLVAPDLPGFGFSEAPDRKEFRYSFENLAKIIDRFTKPSVLTDTRSTSLTMELLWGFASLCPIPRGSPPSSRRMATLMKKV